MAKSAFLDLRLKYSLHLVVDVRKKSKLISLIRGERL
jgi:hypothetical protein